MIPKTYLSKQEGDYKRWTGGHVNMTDLTKQVTPNNETIYVNGIQVFGFCFEMESGVTLWNCKFGWLRKGML